MKDLINEIKMRMQIFEPSQLHIFDDIEEHENHMAEGAHIRIIIQSEKFQEKTHLMKHRMIYTVLQDLMPHRIHSLELSFK